jgi:hypothetical protein
MAEKKAAAKDKPKKKPAVTGFAPLKFKEFTILQKRTGKFEVQNAKGKNVNGADKVKLLLEAKVMKGSFKNAPKAEAAAT